MMFFGVAREVRNEGLTNCLLADNFSSRPAFPARAAHKGLPVSPTAKSSNGTTDASTKSSTTTLCAVKNVFANVTKSVGRIVFNNNNNPEELIEKKEN